MDNYFEKEGTRHCKEKWCSILHILYTHQMRIIYHLTTLHISACAYFLLWVIFFTSYLKNLCLMQELKYFIIYFVVEFWVLTITYLSDSFSVDFYMWHELSVNIHFFLIEYMTSAFFFPFSIIFFKKLSFVNFITS